MSLCHRTVIEAEQFHAGHKVDAVGLAGPQVGDFVGPDQARCGRGIADKVDLIIQPVAAVDHGVVRRSQAGVVAQNEVLGVHRRQKIRKVLGERPDTGGVQQA